jgi:integrase
VSVYEFRGHWRFRKVVRLASGLRKRVSGTAQINTRRGAEDAERRAIEETLRLDAIATYAPTAAIVRGARPTLAAWFRGRYWTEYVVGEKQNRSGTQHEKLAAFEHHIEPVLGALPLDEIDLGKVNELRAELATKTSERTGEKLSDKTRDNILVVLSSALNYAEEARVIDAAPRIRIKSRKPPDIPRWTFEEYGRMLGGAEAEGGTWLAALLFAGDCGLRIGEILALEHRRDIDLVAGIVRVQRQERRGALGPPKGGAGRDVPMTARLVDVLRSLPKIRTGRVITGEDGGRVTESIARVRLYRACRRAELPDRLWHCARHTFASHAALLGASPYVLQGWLGHASYPMTQRYVSWAATHRWPIPAEVLAAGAEELQPDRRVTAQLGARAPIAPAVPSRGKGVPTPRQALRIAG